MERCRILCVASCGWMSRPPPTFSPCRWFPPPPPPPPVFFARLEKNTPVPGIAFARCGFAQQGSGETEKTPPETEQAAGLPGSMIGFKSGETRQPTQVLNGCFASLQVFVAIGCAHAKGVRLASRSLFSQRLDAWRRAVECRRNGRGGHDQKNLLEKTYADEDANPPTWVMPRSWLSLR